MRINGQNGIGAVVPVIVIAVIGIVATAGWFVYKSQHQPVQGVLNASSAQSSTTVSKPAAKKAADLKPLDVTAKIKSDVATEYTLLDTGKNNHPGPGQASVQLAERSPSVKVKGNAFYSRSESGSSIDLIIGPVDYSNEVYPKAHDSQVRSRIAADIKSFGLALVDKTDPMYYDAHTDRYVGKGLVCDAIQIQEQSTEVGANCGLLASYPAAANNLKPYVRAINDDTPNAVYENPKITESSSPGYRTARVGVSVIGQEGGFTYQLYQKTGGEWKLFKKGGTDFPSSCDDYATTDLKNAYRGEKCYDASDRETTVQ